MIHVAKYLQLNIHINMLLNKSYVQTVYVQNIFAWSAKSNVLSNWVN